LKREKIRVTFDLSADAKTQLEEVQTKSRSNTLTEVFRRAVALYELVLDAQADKRKILIENPDGSREVLRVL